MNLLDNDQLDDRFFLSVSPNGKYFATGGYNKSGHVVDMNATMNSSIVCKFDQARDAAVGSLKVYGKNKRLIQGNNGISHSPGAIAANSSALDKASELRKRVSMGAWKPVSP